MSETCDDCGSALDEGPGFRVWLPLAATLYFTGRWAYTIIALCPPCYEARVRAREGVERAE